MCMTVCVVCVCVHMCARVCVCARVRMCCFDFINCAYYLPYEYYILYVWLTFYLLLKESLDLFSKFICLVKTHDKVLSFQVLCCAYINFSSCI